jgi:hypothetical protein
MHRYKGGDWVAEGTYWNLASGRRVDATGEGLALPGGRNLVYLRMPAGVMLLFGPLFGLLYIIFFPLIGIAALSFFTVRALFRGAFGLLSRAMYFEWRPAEAYLAGRKRRAAKKNQEKESGSKQEDREPQP